MEESAVSDYAGLQPGRPYWLRSPGGPVYEARFLRPMHASGAMPGPVEFEVHFGRVNERITLSPEDEWTVFESNPEH